MRIAGITTAGAAISLVVAEQGKNGTVRLVTFWQVAGGPRDQGVPGVLAVLASNGATSIALEHPEIAFPGADVRTLPVAYELAYELGRDRTLGLSRVTPAWRDRLGKGGAEQRLNAETIALETFGKSWPVGNNLADPVAAVLTLWAHGKVQSETVEPATSSPAGLRAL